MSEWKNIWMIFHSGVVCSSEFQMSKWVLAVGSDESPGKNNNEVVRAYCNQSIYIYMSLRFFVRLQCCALGLNSKTSPVTVRDQKKRSEKITSLCFCSQRKRSATRMKSSWLDWNGNEQRLRFVSVKQRQRSRTGKKYVYVYKYVYGCIACEMWMHINKIKEASKSSSKQEANHYYSNAFFSLVRSHGIVFMV